MSCRLLAIGPGVGHGSRPINMLAYGFSREAQPRIGPGRGRLQPWGSGSGCVTQPNGLRAATGRYKPWDNGPRNRLQVFLDEFEGLRGPRNLSRPKA